MKKGKLLVIEGIDGSGKTTQVELLKKFLASQGVPWEAISFPRYEDNLYAKLVRRYLEGEFGSINEVNPYLMALAYAGDRVLAKPLIESWLQSGKLVIVNRYVSASKAHLTANLAEDQREQFMQWVDQLEYETNRIPKEDFTILLNMDPKMGQKNVSGGQPDIHEDSLKHLEQAGKIYLELAQVEDNWLVVNCMEDDRMRPKEDIHKDLTAILESKII